MNTYLLKLFTIDIDVETVRNESDQYLVISIFMKHRITKYLNMANG